MNIEEQAFRRYWEEQKTDLLEYKINTVLNGSRDGLTMKTTKNGTDVWSCNDKHLISFRILKKDNRLVLVIKT